MLRYLALALPALIDPPQIYHGRAGNLDVRLPRLEAEIEVDGQLTEEAWGQAAVLTGFSQFSPSDGVPAVDSTNVLVWYSPTAIHFPMACASGTTSSLRKPVKSFLPWSR